MKPTAETVPTPTGGVTAPFDPTFEDRLAECETREELFELVRTERGHVDPDALAEVRARGLYEAYQAWKGQDQSPMEAFAESVRESLRT